MVVKKSQVPYAAPPEMKQVLVAGPLLGSRQRNIASDFAPWDQFEPIITPEIIAPAQKGEQARRFVLLPHSHHISVLAYQTGTQIATLVPFMNDKEAKESSDQILIETVCLASYKMKLAERTLEDVLKMEEDGTSSDDDEGNPQETLEQVVDEVVVLAGCRDGTVREFSLQSLQESTNIQSVSCGSYHVPGPCHRPRRTIQATKKEPIMHLAAPPLRNLIHKDGILTYMTVRTKDLDAKSSDSKKESSEKLNITVLRVLIPFFDGNSQISLIRREEGDVKRKWQLDHFRCRVGKDKVGGFMNTAPFRLTAVSKPVANDCTVFLILGRADRVHVYLDRAIADERYTGMEFSIPTENPLSSLFVSTNNDDIACGHYFGEISVMNGVLSEVEKYHRAMAKAEQHFGAQPNSNNKPSDPRSKLITSKAHWHAHPVGSLVFDSMSSPIDPILYSGGAESVLVTWQMSQGRSKPLDFLPRVSLGSIIHIACADRVDDRPCNGILVYSDDNSLQLFESHGKGKRWKIQGLCCGLKNDKYALDQKTIIEVDPRGKGANDAPLVITGLPEAPGFMYWYAPSKRRVTASLEIAPFNRVSKTEAEDAPMPAPSVTNHTFCNEGKELITLEETPTENVYVGAFDDRAKKGAYGVVTTIRFWRWNKESGSEESPMSRNPYTLTAAMSFPHGPKNRVSALAASQDGSIACSVSNDEKAFRLWRKVIAEDDEGTKRIPAWTCHYKVTIPAGFSNFSTERNGVDFSGDGSILAVCCGNMVTLWDSSEARFLTSLRHLEGSAGPIDAVKFISSGLLQDVLLIKSELGVSLQSPFGSRSGHKGWSWGVPTGLKSVRVSAADFLPSHGCVAVTVFHSASGRSRLIFIDAMTGKPGLNGAGPAVLDEIDGCIISLSAAGEAPKKSNWDDEEPSEDTSMRLYSLANNGNLSLFTEAGGFSSTFPAASKDQEVELGPTMSISRGRHSKRQRESEPMSVLQQEPLSKKSALDIFSLVSIGDNKAAAPATSDLPLLSRNFVRSFVGRRLMRGSGHDQEE